MDLDVNSTAEPRNNMVDGQLRPNKVTDKRIVDAMRRLKRELFVPAAMRDLAYADVEVPLGDGRVLLAPMVVARLIQALDLPKAGKVLVLGAGYAAAVVAACGTTVIVVESDATLIASARAAYAASGLDIPVIASALATGWSEEAPYDAILIDGAVPELPDLAAQLKPAPIGRLCAILALGERSGVAVLAEAAGGILSQRALFDCTATVLPQFVVAPSFRF